MTAGLIIMSRSRSSFLNIGIYMAHMQFRFPPNSNIPWVSKVSSLESGETGHKNNEILRKENTQISESYGCPYMEFYLSPFLLLSW